MRIRVSLRKYTPVCPRMRYWVSACMCVHGGAHDRNACMYECVRIHMRVCVSACTYVCVCVCVYICVCMCVCVCIYISMIFLQDIHTITSFVSFLLLLTRLQPNSPPPPPTPPSLPPSKHKFSPPSLCFTDVVLLGSSVIAPTHHRWPDRQTSRDHYDHMFPKFLLFHMGSRVTVRKCPEKQRSLTSR